MEQLIVELLRRHLSERHSCNLEIGGVPFVLLPSFQGLTAPHHIPIYIQRIWGVAHARDDQAPCSPDDGKPFL